MTLELRSEFERPGPLNSFQSWLEYFQSWHFQSRCLFQVKAPEVEARCGAAWEPAPGGLPVPAPGLVDSMYTISGN